MINSIHPHPDDKTAQYSGKVRDKFTTYGLRRAAAAAGVFSIIGLIALTSVVDWNKSWLLILFYALLVLNTYFSVRCFSSIAPRWEIKQELIDAALAVLYVMMVLNFNFAFNFVAISTLLFMVAVIKYVLLAEIIGYSKLLRRKIFTNTLGILLCFLTLIGILWGYGSQALPIWVAAFALTNIYLLLLKPLYNPKDHYETGK